MQPMAGLHAFARSRGRPSIPSSASSTSVSGKQAKRLTLRADDDSEMPLVKGEQIPAVMALSQNDQRGVRQANLQVGVPLDDPGGSRHVDGIKWFELISASLDVVEELEGLASASVRRDEVVQLGENKRREESRLGLAEDFSSSSVLGLPRVNGGQDAARVQDDQAVPNPLRYSSDCSAK